MRSFLNSIPESLAESASLDGAGTMTTLLRIIIPVSLPGIATIGLFYGVMYWNQFFDAVLYISKRDNWIIQILLREILMNTQPDVMGSGIGTTATLPTKMGIVIMAVIPIAMIYPFIQKHFVKGVMVGAVKG